jgi:hypothetical protein
MVARRKSASKLFSSARLALACNRVPPAPGCGSAPQRSVRGRFEAEDRTHACRRSWFNQASPRRRPSSGERAVGSDLVGRPRSAGRRDPPKVERGRGHGVARRLSPQRGGGAGRDAGSLFAGLCTGARRKGYRRRKVLPHQAGKCPCRGVFWRPFPARQRSSRRVASGRTRTSAAASSAVMASAGLWLMPFLQRKKIAPAGQRRAMIPASRPARTVG